MTATTMNLKFPTIQEDHERQPLPGDHLLAAGNDYNASAGRERGLSHSTQHSTQSFNSNGPNTSSISGNGAGPSMNGNTNGWKPATRAFSHSNGRRDLGEAFRDLKSRRRSLSVSAIEIADALKAPVSPKFVALCIIWYISSATTNTSSKTILNAFPRPVTLTMIQFMFVPLWCVVFSYGSAYTPALRHRVPALRNGLQPPSMHVVRTTLPMALFAVSGHILSSSATNKIDVSLVHTIKGMSPLFTVVAYRLFFHIHYSLSTYLSLIPLTIGVMLACSADFSGNFVGIFFAFASSIVFVSQNIFSKKLFNDAAVAEKNSYIKTDKLDKLNLLCYSSSFAFFLSIPLWLYSEAFQPSPPPKKMLSMNSLVREFLFNAFAHFAQNILAFILLSMVSPVTYSVASLVKRIFVVAASIFYFGNSTTPIQAVGIALTFFGVYLYDRAGDHRRGSKGKMVSSLPMTSRDVQSSIPEKREA